MRGLGDGQRRLQCGTTAGHFTLLLPASAGSTGSRLPAPRFFLREEMLGRPSPPPPPPHAFTGQSSRRESATEARVEVATRASVRDGPARYRGCATGGTWDSEAAGLEFCRLYDIVGLVPAAVALRTKSISCCISTILTHALAASVSWILRQLGVSVRSTRQYIEPRPHSHARRR